MEHAARVLQLIASDGVYGAERVILNLSCALRQRREFAPVVGCIVGDARVRSAMREAAVAEGLEAWLLPASNSRFWIDLPRLAAGLRGQGVSLIHAHGYKPSVYGFVIARLLRVPVIATCHLWFRPEDGPLKKRVMVALEKRLYRSFPRVLAVSREIREVLLQAGVEPHRADVIPNGVDIDPARPDERELRALRADLGLSQDDFCVVNSARLTAQKAQWTLVEAAALLKARGVPCRFLIVGDGELKAELRHRIEAKSVADCVSLLGFRGDVTRLLAAADAFALPSVDEGMPMSLLEAAALRVPIIATAVGDVPNLVGQRESGLIVRPNDPGDLAEAIMRLRSDRGFGAALAAQAHTRLAALYSTHAMCDRYENVYRAVLGERR